VKGFGLEQRIVKEKDWNGRGTRIFGSAMNKTLELQQVVLDQLVSTDNTTDTNTASKQTEVLRSLYFDTFSVLRHTVS
jgi:hypothetical protein